MLEITEGEFNKIVSSHVVAPHKYQRGKNIQTGPRLHDRDKWIEQKKLDRSYVEKKLSEHGFK